MTNVSKEAMPPERIGKFKMRVAVSDEPSDRWEQRSEALARWLLAQWERERKRRIAERN